LAEWKALEELEKDQMFIFLVIMRNRGGCNTYLRLSSLVKRGQVVREAWRGQEG